MSSPPTGTVTFLFADVEGSTALQQDPQVDYAAAIAFFGACFAKPSPPRAAGRPTPSGDEYVAAFADGARCRDAALRDAARAAGRRVAERHASAYGSACTSAPRRSATRATRASTSCARRASRTPDTEARSSSPTRRSGRSTGFRAATSASTGSRGSRGPSGSTSCSPTTCRATSRLSQHDLDARRRDHRRSRRRHRPAARRIARLLADAGFDVVAQSGNPDDLLRHVAMHTPGVAIVDIRMPPTHTDEGFAQRRRSGDTTAVRACSCSRSTSRRRTRWTSSRETRPRASGTC